MTGAGQVERCYPAIETDEHGSFACMRGSPTGAYMLYAECAALLREVEGLKAALDKYGRHFGWCAAISSRNTAEGCSCGFDAALSPASGGGEAAALPSQDSAPQTRVANLNKVHSEALQDIWWVCESRMRAEQKVAEIRKITANQDLE